ncbi:class I adenylate-forming enzyme family protein [Chloroflexota bacterium]
MNLGLMLEEVAKQYKGKTAITSGDCRLSYADLNEASNKVANTLIKMGVNKGDRVAMLLSNSPESVITYFGIVKIGAIAVPLDTDYKADELASIFNDCLPKVLLTESPTLELLIPFLSRFKSIKHIIDIGSRYTGKFSTFREIMAAGSTQKIEAEPEPDDTAYIAYTSGPSFHPRGTMLSHQSLLREMAASAGGFQQTDNDIMMLYSLPMHHVFGLVAALLASIYKGSMVVIVPGTGLSFNSFVAAIEREKGTMFLGVPYIFALAIDIAEKDGIKSDLSSLRLCASCGAPLSVDTVRRFKQHYGFEIIDCWGLTEAVCHVTCPPLNGTGKPGSVGKALSGWEVRVVDESGRELPPNQAGELIVRGPLMKGYYNKPQATSQVIKDGWLYTGDIGKSDDDGYLYITGRKKELIITKGQNVYPSDIEAVLLMHPSVADAAVLCVPDEMRGEVAGAVVSLRAGEVATEQEIKRFCLERIANYKVPKQVFFMDSLPKTANGKINKESLRVSLSIPPLF